MTALNLVFDPADIEALADRYSYGDDAAPREAGAAAAKQGHYDLDGFLTVCRWKAPRAERHFVTNSEVQVRAATGLAFSTHDEIKCMDSLTGLAGVGVPMGSTLLQFAFPDSFPILDWRTLESLGQAKRTVYSSEFWTQYLAACRRIAKEAGVGMRALDKALWQFSRERTRGMADPTGTKPDPEHPAPTDALSDRLAAMESRIEALERRIGPS